MYSPLPLPSQIQRPQWSRPWSLESEWCIVEFRSHASHWTFPELFRVKWEACYHSFRILCVCVCVCVYLLMHTQLICLNAVLRILQVLNNTLYQAMHHSIPWIPHPSPLSFLFLTTFSDLPQQPHSLTQNFTYLIRYAWRGLGKRRKKRVSYRAASVKRMENEGDKGQLWRS